ncbi:MAG: hypothetical protein IH587_03330 [Anaerolineae bacterium]|nr:hypothetical protein [Anaerolineae bacterium]
MSFEYIFFDAELCDRFAQFLSSHGLVFETSEDSMEGFVIEIPDDPSDDMLESIEERYQALMDEQMVQAGTQPDLITHQVVGVEIKRLDGSACTVRLPASVARGLLEHFSPDEVHALVTAIAQSLDHPVDAPLCCKDEAALIERRG